MPGAGTRALLLSEAEALLRRRGYSAFSFADLSERVGIRKASIHHHFPTKEALGNALIDDYLERFLADLAALEQRRWSTKRKLIAYGGSFAGALREEMMPLCGALAADAAYLPASMRLRVERFFALHLEWLERVLAAGVAAGELRPRTDVARAARLILSTLEGASLLAWAIRDPTVIEPALKDALLALA